MKNVMILSAACFLATCISIYAIEFSYSDNGFGIDADIKRVGENIQIKYSISGMNNIPSNYVTAEQQKTLSGVSNADINMVVSCKAPKMKVINANISGSVGNVNTGDSGWITLDNPEDIAKVRELCNRY